MSKLRENIDRILGNSIRCLLPSYWWKRIFGLVVDEVEGKASKASLAALEKKMENFKGGGIQVITIYPLETSMYETHTQAYNDIKNENDVIIYAQVGEMQFPATAYTVNPQGENYHSIDFQGWRQIEIHEGLKTEREHYSVSLYDDGTLKLQTVQDSVIDHTLSATSENPVTGKVIKAYVDNAVANVTIDTSSLATKEEVMENERVTAAALYDLDTRVKDILTRLDTSGL